MEDDHPDGALPGPLRPAQRPKCRRLAALIARYGQAIQYDLATRTEFDLGTEWRARRWRRLLQIIDWLPRDSAYVEALADDEELAEQSLRRNRGDKDKTPRRKLSDWSPTVEVLTAILDRLGELTQAVAALGGAKPRKIPRAPHPVTAFDRVRNRVRREKHRSLVARVLPDRNKKDPQAG